MLPSLSLLPCASGRWSPSAILMFSAVRNGSPCLSRSGVGLMFALRDKSCFRPTADGDHTTDMRRLCTRRSLHSLPITPWAESDDTSRTTSSQKRAEPAVKNIAFLCTLCPLIGHSNRLTSVDAVCNRLWGSGLRCSGGVPVRRKHPHAVWCSLVLERGALPSILCPLCTLCAVVDGLCHWPTKVT